MEDGREDALVVSRALTDMGYEGVLIHAADLETANQVLDANPVDLVLLDLHLPDGSGFDLLHNVHEKESPPVVLALTGSSAIEHINQAHEQGADGYMVKPARPQEYRATVQSALDLWHSCRGE